VTSDTIEAPLRIAVVAPPWYALPPQGYGGIELVVTLLVRDLRARGHSVLVFGAEGSDLGTIACAPQGWDADLGQPSGSARELTYLARVCRRLGRSGSIDVIHDHSGFAGVLAATLLDVAPVVHTVHGPLFELQRTFYRSLGDSAGLVAISHSQRRSAPALSWLGTVHNAVDVAALRTGTAAERGGYLLCLARVCSDKGQHVAIEVARRTGRRLVLAGKVEDSPEGRAYFEESIAPFIDGDLVVHIPNVAGVEKADLLARAHALLAPIHWPEPFGLSVAEALVSGTPAISFSLGAASELIDHGTTGFVVDDVDRMVAAVADCTWIDPLACARTGRARFHPRVMGERYLGIYAAVAAGGRLALARRVMESAGSVA
jgi:glycosyltransferase involved in cell wall biosynthesis